MVRRCGALILYLASLCVSATAASPETTLGTVLDFSAVELGPYQRGFFDHWRWDETQRDRARAASNLEIVENDGRKCLRVRVTDASLLAPGPLPLLRLAPFYPPEADVLRLHVKVIAGKVRAFAGGPTAYYANSDVYTRTEALAAASEPQWATLDFSLNHPLRRNFRRSGFSTDAERNYYNRWAQEPLGVFLDAGTSGEFLLERVEVLSRGEGRPFPKFASDAVTSVQRISAFEDIRDREALFTLYMAANEVEWFDESWRREKPLRFTPARLEIVDAEETPRGKVLRHRGPSAEEVHCAGIRTAGATEANALRLAVRHDAPDYNNRLVGVGRAEALDVLVIVAPSKRPAVWQAFAASDELRKLPGPGFDFQLSYRILRERQDLDFAVYQTRRYVKPREWTTLVLPAADFVCIYGSGSYRDRFVRNQPLTCGDVTAVAWLNPWCRSGRGNSEVTLELDDLAFVRVPGNPTRLRSFWQLDAGATVEWRELAAPPGRERVMLVDGEAW